MDALHYYNDKSTRRRLLTDGDGIRNTHNFIKSALIAEYTDKGSHVIDLGCGQGGDLLKYKRCSLSSYRGIDVSHTAIDALARRIACIDMRCRVTLECFDFTKRMWASMRKIDVVSCQFALQYAFSSKASACHVLACVSRVLRVGGVLIGTIPIHDKPAYSPVVVQLPNDSRLCVEFSAPRQEVEKLCALMDLRLESWNNFKQYYDHKVAEHPALAKTMRAFSPPGIHNAVFVFRKTKEKSTRGGDADTMDKNRIQRKKNAAKQNEAEEKQAVLSNDCLHDLE